MKVLVLGSGGREHALVHTFHRQGHTAYASPGNPGMARIARLIPPSSFEELARLVEKEKIDLTVVGPEALLDQGIADFFATRSLPLFGPTKSAARLESSKAFAKEFMQRNSIPTARFAVCSNPLLAEKTARSFLNDLGGVVIKPSGLTGGKGVVCCKSFHEAKIAIQESPPGDLVIEELLQGPEISLLVFCNENTFTPLLPAQDHKRLLDHDLGPNTGGMGAYAPVDIDPKLFNTVLSTTHAALQRENISYRGILYFGLMLTDEGPKVLEYNCRFGDPETQALLPLLKTDLAAAMLSKTPVFFEWEDLSSCCVVLASKSYPSPTDKLPPLDCVASLEKKTLVFHGGTGRVLSVVGLGKDLQQAISITYEAIETAPIPWAHYRRDIGKRADLSSPLR